MFVTYQRERRRNNLLPSRYINQYRVMMTQEGELRNTDPIDVHPSNLFHENTS